MSIFNAKKFIFLFFLLLISLSKSYSQNQTDNWYFGQKAGINFSGCNPVTLLNSDNITLEGVATISDQNGNLLFYTDGLWVYNRQHNPMPNGMGLNGGTSSTQSAIIVPKPGSNTIYYVFTIDDELGNDGICYSIIDMTLDAGRGAVTQKNISLLPNIHEKLTAVRHGNNNDIWIISRQVNSNKYFSWLVTAGGVSTTPVISSSPNYVPNPYQTSEGYLKASSDGKKLFCSFVQYEFSELSLFNDITGVVSNIIKVSNRPLALNRSGIPSVYGVEFSPNNKYLYVSNLLEYQCPCSSCDCFNNYLHQYTITTHDSSTIASSVIMIDSGSSVLNPLRYAYKALQIAKNGKIYIAQYNQNTLSSIENPDQQAPACNLVVNSVNLGNKRCFAGLPTFIQSYFNPNYRVYDFSYTEDCQMNISFSLNTTFTYDSLKWNFGDVSNNTSTFANQIHSYNSPGVRTVKLYIYNHYGCINKLDSVVKNISVGVQWFTFGIDKFLCAGDNLTLDATTPNATSYLWNTGQNSSTITINNAGLYWCEVSKGTCVFRDTISIFLKPYPVVNLGVDQTLCEGQTVILNVTNTGASYLWQDNSNLPVYIINSAGNYFVTVDLNGCIKRDTVSATYNLRPHFDLGPDRNTCRGSVILLNPNITNAQFLWQDGSIGSTYSVTDKGIYYLDATNSCGTTRDSITIKDGQCLLIFPNSFTPNGDNTNDVFTALNTDNLEKFQLNVFDKYGHQIFSTTEPKKGWDGKYLNKFVNQGTYVWICKFTLKSERESRVLSGTVNVIK